MTIWLKRIHILFLTLLENRRPAWANVSSLRTLSRQTNCQFMTTRRSILSAENQIQYKYTRIPTSRHIGHEMVTICFFSPRVLGLHDTNVHRCFTTQSRSPLLAIADAEGQVSLHDWDIDAVCTFGSTDHGYCLSHLYSQHDPPTYLTAPVYTQRRLNQSSLIKCAEQSVLCLSLDWSNRQSPTE